MTLNQLRNKRTLIKNEIDRKHNDWLELATNDQLEAAEICSATLESLWGYLKETDQQIVTLKQQLIEEALNA